MVPFHRKIRYQSEIVASGPCDIQRSKLRFQCDISSISTCGRRSQHVAGSLNRWREEEKVILTLPQREVVLSTVSLGMTRIQVYCTLRQDRQAIDTRVHLLHIYTVSAKHICKDVMLLASDEIYQLKCGILCMLSNLCRIKPLNLSTTKK